MISFVKKSFILTMRNLNFERLNLFPSLLEGFILTMRNLNQSNLTKLFKAYSVLY